MDPKPYTMSRGDLESQERGSAARADGGKPRWELMPLGQIAFLMSNDTCVEPLDSNMRTTLPNLVGGLGSFQQSGDRESACEVLRLTFLYLREQLDTDFTGACEEVIRVWEHGEKKYAQFNWMKGMSWSAVIGSYMRHIQWLLRGETQDQESGRHHGAHLICNAMMLVHFVDYYKQGNDLPTRWFELEEGNDGERQLHRGSEQAYV